MAPEKAIVREGDSSQPPALRLLHFNDVYHVIEGSKDPCGGVARFQTLCDYYRHDDRFRDQPDLVTIFSGDAFNPSLESSVTKGAHMVPVLNNIGVDVACVGNHDFDFGIPQFTRLTKQSHFPWLLSNIFAAGGKAILADCPPTHLVTASNGIKIGFVGVAEQEWISTVSALSPDLPFLSAAEAVTKYAAELRAQGAEMIVAVCHQREVNDNRLAAEVAPGTIDMIAAGHDHDYRYSKINGCHVLCSGSDFKQMSYIEARRKTSGGWDFDIVRRDITKDIKEDKDTVELMDKHFSAFRAKLEKPVGYTTVPLDARFSTVRKAESNFANFVADLVRNYYSGDCAMIVGGTFRGDQIYRPGIIRIKDLLDCFPFEDPDVMISTPGHAIKDALENGVSKWPALEGRFPQVSRISFAFDPARPAGSRITSLEIGGKPLDPQRQYKLVTRAYTVGGGDGFTSLRLKENGGHSTYIVDEENGSLTSTLLRQYFMSLKVMYRWKQESPELEKHWGGVCNNLHKVQPVKPPSVYSPTSQRSTARNSVSQQTAPSSPTLTTRLAKRQRLGSRTEEANNNPPIVLGTPASTAHDAEKETTDAGGDHDSASDSEEDPEDFDADTVAMNQHDKQHRTLLIRRVLRRWRAAAGIDGEPGMCDEIGEGVHWTQGIAPTTEGRIKIIGVRA